MDLCIDSIMTDSNFYGLIHNLSGDSGADDVKVLLNVFGIETDTAMRNKSANRPWRVRIMDGIRSLCLDQTQFDAILSKRIVWSTS